MQEPVISVIVPVYRVEKYLRRCVDSILGQTYKNLDIVLVDDGSNDNCPSICDEYSMVDTRVNSLHKSNGGLSDARNFGIEHAKGDFLVFVDSDDYINSNMIRKLYESLVENDSDIAICGFDYVDESGNKLPKQKRLSISGAYNKEDIYHFYDREGVSWVLGVAWNKLYRKKLFSTLRYPKGKLHEDDFISFHLYAQIDKVSFINENLYFYTQRSYSIMGDKLNIRHVDGVEALLNRIDFALETKRFYLIPNTEDRAFGILFSLATKAIHESDKSYIGPVIQRYKMLFPVIKEYCNHSVLDKIKRSILFSDGTLLWLCRRIRNI